MALIWLDGFDSYGANGSCPTAILLQEGYQGGVGTPDTLTSSTRTGSGMALVCFGDNVLNRMPTTRVLDHSEPYLVVGLALNYDPVSAVQYFVRFDYIALGGVTTTQCMAGVNRAGQIVIATQGSGLGSGTIVANTGTNRMYPGTWYFFEVKWDAVVGLCEIRVDNDVALTFNGSVLAAGTPTSANAVFIGATGSMTNVTIDDLYILNNASGITDYLGDHVVVTSLPASDASPNQWSPSTAGSHYPLVADAENDVTYVGTDTPGNSDLFGLTALPSSVVGVTAAQIHMRASRDSTDVLCIALGAKGTASVSSTKTIGTGPQGYDMIMEAGPDGAWSPAAANALQIGVTAS